MPLLSELREITTPVEIRRGNLTFTLNVALEKFTPEEGEYGRLRSEIIELAYRKNSLNAKNEELKQQVQDASDLQAIRVDLIERNGFKEARESIAANDALDDEAKMVAYEEAEAQINELVTDDMVQAEFYARLEQANEAGEANRKELNEVRTLEHRNVAARLAYLVASSDIEVTPGQPALSGKVEKTDEEYKADTDFFFKNMSIQLLLHSLGKVEDAVYGPLETASSSDK